MPRDFGRGDDRRGDRGDRGDRHGGSGRGINPNYFLPKPVKVGDEVDVKIEAMASKGDGIAKKDGFVIFVKDAKEGQTLRVKITEVRTRFAMGEVLGEAEAAPEASAESAPESDESEEA
jgi:predicted RNA-binding protein with TRAM domain